MIEHITAYRRKRDHVVAGLTEAGYRSEARRAFYVFPEVLTVLAKQMAASRGWGKVVWCLESGTDFVGRAIG
ncbi:MAG: hypothetical protein U0805_13560 [Pirellulales bacterium]